jgi:hypothetical protein
MKSTPRQQQAFKVMLEKFAKHEPVILGQIMREVGYSPNTAINPALNLTSKPGWELLKRQLDSGGAIQTFNELVSPDNQDKRTRLASAIEITKITDGYPKSENKVIGLFEKIGELQNDKPTTTPE